MSQWIKSEKDAERIIAAELAVAVAPIVFMAARWAFYALGNQIAEAAGYDCAKQQCTTEDAEHIIAAYTIWLVIFTGFLAAFTAALFIATYLLFRTAAEDGAKALDQSRELFAAERRPWIRLTYQITSNMQVFADRHGEVTITATATNVGLSPAVLVRIHWTRPTESWEHLNFLNLAADMERHRKTRLNNGVTLFPGETHSIDWPIRAPLVTTEFGFGRGPIVTGWAVYRFSGDEEKAHVTPLFMELTWQGEPDFIEGYTVAQMELQRVPIQLQPD